MIKRNKWYIKSHKNMDEFKCMLLSEGIQPESAIGFHFYDILEKVNYKFDKQISGCSGFQGFVEEGYF